VKTYARTLHSVLATVLMAISLVAVSSAPASAAAPVVVIVSTTADVSDAADGLISLREAFDIANTNGDDTIVQLGSELTYQLTQCVAKDPVESGGGFFVPPDDEDANLDGDLDHFAVDDLTIEGNGAVIQNTCLYDRVLHNLEEDSLLTLNDVTVTGGNSPPGFGTNIWAPGRLTMTNVAVTDGVSDIGSQAAAVVVGLSVPDNLGLLLTMTDTSILGNAPGGVRVVTGDAEVTNSIISGNDGAGFTLTFGELTMDWTVLLDNNGNGVSGIDGSLQITNSAAGNNSGFGFRNTGNAESGQPLNLTNVFVVDNATGGVECSFCTGLNILNTTVSSNDGVGVAMRANVEGPTMTITNSTITDNVGSGSYQAGGVEMDTIAGPASTVTISRSTIAGNTSSPGGDGGGIRVTNTSLEVFHSTITNNVALGQGGGIDSVGAEPVSLDYVTLVENTTAAGAANLRRESGELISRATVVAMPIGGVNCSGLGIESSNGFNQVSDLSCGLGGSEGDVAPSDDPMLAPLSPNGGPTPTRIPLTGSPLLGAVTGPVCDTAGEDQRGISRPQGAGCEVGAVEENEVLTAVMLVGRTSLLAPDAVLRDWLESQEYVIELVDDDDLGPAAIAQLGDADLVLMSSSVRLNKVRPFVSELKDLPVPILTMEGYLTDDLGLATSSGETKKKTRQVDIVDAGSGLAGRVTVMTNKNKLSFGIVGGDAHVVATVKGVGAPPVVFSYGAGDELADGSIAAGARGAFLFDYFGPLSARPDAFVLLDYLHDRIVPSTP